MTETAPQPVFTHLLKLTDHRATFERADLAEPLRAHGYSTDDMARVLVVTTRQPESSGEVNGLAGKALQFLNDAQSYNGACRNRMDRAGHWADQPTTGDHWGRCLLALGTAAAHSDVTMVRRLATIQFERAAKARSTSPRAMAYAAIGAAEIVSVEPGNSAALRLLTDYAVAAEEHPDDAVLAEAMIATGVALESTALQHRGLDALERLLAAETSDRQPTEVATLAEACARAAASDPRQIWPDGVRSAVAWFQGANAGEQLMWDPQTGAGFDGVPADGVDSNRGAASTLAVISTLQHALRLSPVPL